MLIYGRLATTCGYTQQEIDSLTLPYVLDLFTYWKTTPPVHEMVAAYFGIGKNAVPEGQLGPEDMAAMLEANGGKVTRKLHNG